MKVTDANDKDALLFLNLNQNASCISAGTHKGFAIYNCEPFKKCFQKDIGGIGIAEMLYCTSLVALVGAGENPAFSPRRLRMWNTKSGGAICDLNFVTAVLAVRMNTQRLVVILERTIHIFDIKTMKILQSLDTSPNPNALCVLSPHENGHLAFPSGASPGEIVLYDANNLSVLNAFQAHRTSPVAMTFNADGTQLATASETGTLIRVFGVPSGRKMAAFRRGSYPAFIYCLAFNETSTILCASSDTGTIHFFSLDGTESSATGSFGVFAPITSTLATPRDTNDAAGTSKGSSTHSTPKSKTLHRPGAPNSTSSSSSMDQKEHATLHMLASETFIARIRSNRVANICAIHGPDQDNIVRLYVITIDGYFYEYSMHLEVGGECKLQRENVLRETASEEIQAVYLNN
uniref:Autophagyrelated protein putative n=1 Tax=Albugo laibachii Nc14 TaxID=890382 RepID=F0W938_9STRA|nr:autophagyrelated protein putative [Albugo laibachii Nc14]|eukprot:CCA17650.1 autophagyrelated protein putative [Albugo laibachii Nc14]